MTDETRRRLWQGVLAASVLVAAPYLLWLLTEWDGPFNRAKMAVVGTWLGAAATLAAVVTALHIAGRDRADVRRSAKQGLEDCMRLVSVDFSGEPAESPIVADSDCPHGWDCWRWEVTITNMSGRNIPPGSLYMNREKADLYVVQTDGALTATVDRSSAYLVDWKANSSRSVSTETPAIPDTRTSVHRFVGFFPSPEECDGGIASLRLKMGEHSVGIDSGGQVTLSKLEDST